MRFLLTAAALLLLLSCPACYKKGTRGRVLEYGTDQPIKNATVILSECESDGNFSGNINCFEVGCATTDADGSWGFETDGFTVGAEAPRYWSSGDDYQVISGDGKPIDLHLYPYAWLKVVLRNESGAYKFNGPSLNGGNGNFTLLHNESKEVIYLFYGNKADKYIFSIVEQNGTSPSLDPQKVSVEDDTGNAIPVIGSFAALYFNVNCPGHDTTTVTITY